MGWGDVIGIQKGEGEHLCPLMAHCKRPETYDILVPDGHFIQHVSMQAALLFILSVGALCAS